MVDPLSGLQSDNNKNQGNESLLKALYDLSFIDSCQCIIKSFGGIPLVRGGEHKTYNGDNFIRSVIWEFPSYEKALECHNSKEYQAGWDLAKNTTERHMQVIEGFSTE